MSAAIFIAGCGKKSETPSAGQTPPVAATQSVSEATAPGAAVNSQPVPPVLETNVAAPPAAPDLAQLQRALGGWLVRNHRAPANFEEFAATAGIPIPPPPPGKKYYIVPRTMQIKLVDR